MSTDFFDDDLEKVGKSSPDVVQNIDGVPVRPLEDIGIGRMVRQKAELTNKVADAMDRIERLRSKQTGLEKEKNELEVLTQKQDLYEIGKNDVLNKLSSAIVKLEKDEMQAARMAELLLETVSRFRDSLSDIESIDEDSWDDERFDIELSGALAQVEAAQSMYETALTKIEASSWHKTAKGQVAPESFESIAREAGLKMSFTEWCKVGFALSLPLSILFLILFLVWVFINGGFGMLV